MFRSTSIKTLLYVTIMRCRRTTTAIYRGDTNLRRNGVSSSREGESTANAGRCSLWAKHMFVLGEAHLCQLLRAYADYCNRIRTHLLLKRTPLLVIPCGRLEHSQQSHSSADSITNGAGWLVVGTDREPHRTQPARMSFNWTPPAVGMTLYQQRWGKYDRRQTGSGQRSALSR
jgi:hypothetical protein